MEIFKVKNVHQRETLILPKVTEERTPIWELKRGSSGHLCRCFQEKEKYISKHINTHNFKLHIFSVEEESKRGVLSLKKCMVEFFFWLQLLTRASKWTRLISELGEWEAFCKQVFDLICVVGERQISDKTSISFRFWLKKITQKVSLRNHHHEEGLK